MGHALPPEFRRFDHDAMKPVRRIERIFCMVTPAPFYYLEAPMDAPNPQSPPLHQAAPATRRDSTSSRNESHPEPTTTQPARPSAQHATQHSPEQPVPPQTDPRTEQDRQLLELLVHMSLRLRLRGVDLESSTGLSGRELDLVALITAGGPTSVKSLVADLALPRSTMTAIVDRLEERGLVKRQPNPDDRRSVILEATPAAFEALGRYREGMSGLVDHIKKVLREPEQDEFTMLVRKMADTF